jgi:peptide/nickel transport system substrate-binding protein
LARSIRPRQSLVAGTDPAFWHDGIGLFGTGTPLANDAGIEIMRGPRDYAGVQQALARAGYKGERIVVIAPTDAHGIRVLSLVGTDQLRRAGMNVNLQEMDFGTVVRRWASQAAPDKGGWNVFFTFVDRSAPNTNPYGNSNIRADGLTALPGWPTSPRIEALRAAWLDAVNLDDQRRICAELQMQLWQDVPYIPMGENWQATAYRKDLLDVLPGCFAVFYGVRRA